jgi:hypothetical protein
MISNTYGLGKNVRITAVKMIKEIQYGGDWECGNLGGSRREVEEGRCILY